MTLPVNLSAPASSLTKRQRYELLYAQLDSERGSFKSHWRELSDFIRPRRSRFFVTDVNKGDRRTQKIIDSTATFSARTLSSGMMSGVTSPARPWFRLTTPDQDLAQQETVKEWLHETTRRMQTVFLQSNLYNALPILYGDIGVFGTACMAVLEDEEDVIRCTPFPIGSYMIANDHRLKVRVFMRAFQMTVRQLVMEFCERASDGTYDLSTLSTTVKACWMTGNKETWVEVVHVIEPNDDYDESKAHTKYKQYSSCYYERGTRNSPLRTDEAQSLLREEGFDEFPVLAPRWEVTGEDVYATDCPGMTALGDIKQLQMGERRGAQAIDKMVNPPMTAPTALRGSKASLLPGDITYVDVNNEKGGFRPAYEIRPDIDKLEMKQQQIRLRIQRAFYEDLFLMMAQSDRREITAREIDERHEEKLLALGPVLEQLNQDLLDPLVDRTFAIMMRRGMLSDPPPELHGLNLRVEYISIMAQAQKLVGVSSLERFASFALQIAPVAPQVFDKVDLNQLMNEYGEATGIPPKILVPDEVVQQIQAQRQAQQAQQAKAEQVANASTAANKLAGADTSGKNALTDLMGATQQSQPGMPGQSFGGPSQ